MGRYNKDSGLFTMQEFKNRGVIKMAPDALVFISGNFGTAVVAPVSGATQKIDFQDGITTISVQNNIDPPGSSTASIEINTPIYDEKSNYWISFVGEDGLVHRIPYFVPMMEVKIFFKGRFLVGGEPKYYPAFWGFITNVDESYNGGMYRISLQCADMLHWWQYMNVAFSPSVESNAMAKYNQGLTFWGSRYQEANAFEIIYSLVQDAGMENFTAPSWLGKSTPSGGILSSAEIDQVWLNGIMKYWNQRFKNQVNLLKMYGAKGTLIVDPKKTSNQAKTPDNRQKPPKSQGINKAQEASRSYIKQAFDVDNFTKGFPPFGQWDKFSNLDNAEYLTKLDVATQIKTMVEYEFFQDVNGNFIFKPPFYNLNTKNLMPYRIKPTDVINYSFTTNSEEIVTALEVQISVQKNIADDSWINNVGYHVDFDLTKRFGERYKKIVVWYLSEANLSWPIAAGHLSLQNVKAFSGSVTIPGRPELRLGYPVYIEHKDAFYYVQSINHSFDYGGAFSTTLSLNGLRSRMYDKVQGNGNKWVVQKNKMYKLTKQFSPTPTQSFDPNKTYDQIKAGEVGDPNVKLEQLYRGTNHIKSMSTGKYDIVDMPENAEPGIDRCTIQQDSVPYTDEEGYKVIGSFRYGRGLIPTDVIDEYAVENSLNSTKTQLETARQAQTLVNGIRPASDIESDSMQDYFKTKVNNDIEVAIPTYLQSLNQNVDPDTVNRMIVNASAFLTSGPPAPNGVPLLSNVQDNLKINKNIKTKFSGSSANVTDITNLQNNPTELVAYFKRAGLTDAEIDALAKRDSGSTFSYTVTEPGTTFGKNKIEEQ